MGKNVRNWIVPWAVVALAAWGGAWAGDTSKCQLTQYTALPIALDDAGRMTVPVTIEGQTVKMLVDTGSYTSLLTEKTATRLNLPIKEWYKGNIVFYGGRESNRYVKPNSLKIDNVSIPRLTLMIDPLDDAGFDGIIGGNLLSVFDIDLDMAAGQIGVFSPKHCAGQVVYWTHENFAEIPFDFDEGNHIRLNVELDGKRVRTIIDTGASETVMSKEYARRLFGLDDAQLKDGAHPFKTLALEGVAVGHPDIRLVSDEETKVLGDIGEPELLLGMNVLRHLHLYIAYKERTIYATSAGAH